MSNPRAHSKTHPDKPAYIMSRSGEVVTYLQLEENANRCAHFFRDVGLNIKDKIAILMENNSRFMEISQAAIRAGLYYTPISTHLLPSEIEYIVKNCEAKMFITSYLKREAASELADMLPDDVILVMVDGTIEGYDSYEDLISKFSAAPIADETTGIDILYSSGTTGMPKGIVPSFPDLPFEERTVGVQRGCDLYTINESSVYLSMAPLYHSAPHRTCNIVLYAAGTIIIMESFDALESLSLIEEYGVTHTQGVPTMFIRMLKLSEEDRNRFNLSTLKCAIHGAASIPIPIKEKMIEWWGPILIEYYSGTEQNGATMIFSEDWLKHKGSVGKAILGEIHIVDSDGNELPPGEPGVIYFSGGDYFEYHDDPDKTAESRNSRGWSTLFDMGYVDEEGYLYLTDRKTNMIISGGVNIYPQETENHLVTHPKVKDVAVFGIPHDEFGEEVKAVVQPFKMSDAGPELEQELIEFCKMKLSKMKCPKSVDFIEDFPRTPAGKLMKRFLRDKYWEGKEQNI